MTPMLVSALAGCGSAGSPGSPSATMGTGTQAAPGTGTQSTAVHHHAPAHLHPPVGRSGRDSFAGRIVSGTGRYAGDSGQVKIHVTVHGGGPSRFVTLTVIALPCAGHGHCVELQGVLSGALTMGPGHNPDRGVQYAVAVAGPVRPLGSVTGNGRIQATGFIRQGRETMSIVLKNASGSVEVQARSGLVRGFTSP